VTRPGRRQQRALVCACRASDAAGDAAGGLVGHPLYSRRYLDEVVRLVIARTPFMKHLAMEFVGAGDGWARLRMRYQDENSTARKALHGGAISSLIDTTGAMAAWTKTEIATPKYFGSTVGINVNYLSGAFGEDIFAEGRILKRGKEIIYTDVRGHERGRQAARAGHCRLPHHRARARGERSGRRRLARAGVRHAPAGTACSAAGAASAVGITRAISRANAAGCGARGPGQPDAVWATYPSCAAMTARAASRAAASGTPAATIARVSTLANER